MIKVILDNIVVRPIYDEPKGVIMTIKESIPTKGEVLAVGTGTNQDPMNISVGDKVIFEKNTGIGLEYNGEQLLILSQLNVLAIIE